MKTENSSDVVRFVARPLKISTASAKLLLLHYVEDNDRYQLPLINRELTVKISKQAYPYLLKWLKEQRLIFTVEGNSVTSIQPYQNMNPLPRYLTSEKFCESSQYCFRRIISSSKIINSVFNKLSSLPYVTTHSGTTYDTRGEKHNIMPREMLRIEPLECGCCSKLWLLDTVHCPKCTSSVRVAEKILGFWAVYRSNLPVPSAFYIKIDGEKVKVDGEGLDLTRNINETLREIMG